MEPYRPGDSEYPAGQRLLRRAITPKLASSFPQQLSYATVPKWLAEASLDCYRDGMGVTLPPRVRAGDGGGCTLQRISPFFN